MKHRIVLKWSKIISYNSDSADEVSEDAGVYELLVKQQDDKYKRRYIGQADDLHKRFLEHLSPDEENSCIKKKLKEYACGFDYALLSTVADRKDAEQALYDKYESEATCNQVRPEGSGRGYDIELIEE